MSIDLSGKPALVTGDCRGIGAAVVGGRRRTPQLTALRPTVLHFHDGLQMAVIGSGGLSMALILTFSLAHMRREK
jgi:NAD(P)-dependent dehydrogenase (short-subunit alcohol dehydrogenase family)